VRARMCMRALVFVCVCVYVHVCARERERARKGVEGWWTNGLGDTDDEEWLSSKQGLNGATHGHCDENVHTIDLSFRLVGKLLPERQRWDHRGKEYICFYTQAHTH